VTRIFARASDAHLGQAVYSGAMTNLRSDPGCPPTLLPALLLVAPNGRVQESLRVLLSDLPLKVIGPVADARSALALVQEWQPPLVLLDFGLPAAEAGEVLERLHAHSPAVRCLALVETVDQLAEAKAGQVDGILLKGYRLDDLTSAIDKLLADPGPGLAPPPPRLNKDPSAP
jgi:CheY-like chemotaxis protein